MSVPPLNPVFLLPAILGLGASSRARSSAAVVEDPRDAAEASPRRDCRAVDTAPLPDVVCPPRRPPGFPGDVPRNNNGWPTIEPAQFSLVQLVYEAENWRRTAISAPGCVGDGEWKTYINELLRRDYLDELDVRQWLRDGPPRFTYRAPKPDFPNLKRWCPVWDR